MLNHPLDRDLRWEKEKGVVLRATPATVLPVITGLSCPCSHDEMQNQGDYSKHQQQVN